MDILSTSGWDDYSLLDSGDGERLERFGKYILVRPDPQVIWRKKLPQTEWNKADAIFKRIKEDKGTWMYKKQLPQSWNMSWKELTFQIRMSPFKHTGVFPEQALHWSWMQEKIKQVHHQVNILNLFGYTGIASLACASAGAKVTHVDASKPTITWARENQRLSQLEDKPVRWIMEDAMKFCQRELRRGIQYDGIIMDPPAYGHGPTGQVWKFNEHFPQLVQVCKQLLSTHPLFFIVNAYAISSSAFAIKNVFEDIIDTPNKSINVGELVLEEQTGKRFISTGLFGRISFV